LGELYLIHFHNDQEYIQNTLLGSSIQNVVTALSRWVCHWKGSKISLVFWGYLFHCPSLVILT